MLGRRQIREKVMQSLFAQNLSEGDHRIIEKNLFNSFSKIYDLYISLLNLSLEIKELAIHKQDIAKKKKLATQEDLNPNPRFISNQMFNILEINEERREYTDKNKQLKWSKLDVPVQQIFKEFIESDSYERYMNGPYKGFESDKAIFLDLYENFIAENDALYDWLEDQHISWLDDFHIANSMVFATLKSFHAHCGPHIKLFKVFKNSEDEDFARELLRRTLRYSDETTEIIQEKAKNWEIDRIANVDRIILQMAITEFLYFPSIPPKVSINEYVELAKNYSTEKSKVFVNGILDKYHKEITNTE